VSFVLIVKLVEKNFKLFIMPKSKLTKENNFSERVRAVVRKIPAGKTMSYKEVAVAAGKPLAARAVARIMAANYDPDVPCHRVIRSDGSLGGYNRGGIEAKRAILASELT
jgi:O-6-methylguanine DNA methyltransferase